FSRENCERIKVDAVDASKQRLGRCAAVGLAPTAERFEQERARPACGISQRIGRLPSEQIHSMFSKPVRRVELAKCMPNFPGNEPRGDAFDQVPSRVCMLLG